MSYKRFEDLRVWKLSSSLALDILNFTRSSALKNEWDLNRQINRAAISMPSNIAEGHERNSRKEFIYFLYVSRGSCGEVRSLLHLYNGLNLIQKQEYENLRTRLLNLSAAIYRFIESIEKNP